MDTWIVTGGAGFIGSQLRAAGAGAQTDARVVVVDKLTYAGNLESLADVATDPRFPFVKADIADRDAVEQIFREHRPTRGAELRRRDPRRPLHRRPGGLRPDQRGGDLRAARGGARRTSRSSSRGRARALPLPARLDGRGLRLARRRRAPSAETTPYEPNSPYSASKAGADHLVRAYRATYGLPALHHELLEQLRPLPVPGEAASR